MCPSTRLRPEHLPWDHIRGQQPDLPAAGGARQIPVEPFRVTTTVASLLGARYVNDPMALWADTTNDIAFGLADCGHNSRLLQLLP